MSFTPFRLRTIALHTVLLLITILSGVASAQEDYEAYIVQGYTEEEMFKLDQYSSVLGLAKACGINIENEFNSVFSWIEKKHDEGLPDLGMFFLDTTGLIALEAKDDPTISCGEVRQKFDSINFPN